jgi:hypothetical protein
MTERAANIYRQKYRDDKLNSRFKGSLCIQTLALNFHLLSAVRMLKNYLNILLDSTLSNPSKLTVMTTINSTPSHQPSPSPKNPTNCLTADTTHCRSTETLSVALKIRGVISIFTNRTIRNEKSNNRNSLSQRNLSTFIYGQFRPSLYNWLSKTVTISKFVIKSRNNWCCSCCRPVN